MVKQDTHLDEISSLDFLGHSSASADLHFPPPFDHPYPPSTGAVNDRLLPAQGTAAAEFRDNIQIALTQHLPQLLALSQSVVDGIERAYDADVNPNKTADNYASLSLLTSQFYDFLRDTGIGALPMVDSETNTKGKSADKISNESNADLIAMEIVQHEPVNRTINKMSEDELRSSLNTTVDTQYARERRVAENASVVLNRLTTKLPF